MSELTEPQKRALKEIDAGHVAWSRSSLSYWNIRTRGYMRMSTMNALINRDLIVLVGDSIGAGRPVLTGRGREVLAGVGAS